MSRELSDIYDALTTGKQAAESLQTWVRNIDGRDLVRNYLWSINRGLAAYEKLSGNLRDGRQHFHVPDDERSDERPRGANLTQADDGHRLCEMCEGVGVTMIATCEAGYHQEKDVQCPDCDGEGQVEDTPLAANPQEPK